MPQEDSTLEAPNAGCCKLFLARRPLPELQGLNEIRIAVWEILDVFYPWTDETLQYQDRPPLPIGPEKLDEFIRQQINAHNRQMPLIWQEEMIPWTDESKEWVLQKLGRIEQAFHNKDELATIEGLCSPYAGGQKWPVQGNPERWRLYAHLFNRLMLAPPSSLKPEVQIPVSNLFQFFSALEKTVSEPLQRFVDFSLRTQETLQHGRLLTPEERELKRQRQEQKRQEYEIKRYGRILSLPERKQAIRQEQIEKAEEAAHQAKLRAIEAERREAEERARDPLERSRQLRGQYRAISTQALLNPNEPSGHTRPLEPGEKRTLDALRHAHPEGLTVAQLAPLTKKDPLAEETPRGSLDPWLNKLEKRGLVRADGKRPKRWFFAGEPES